MKVVAVQDAFGLDHVVVAERALPTAKPGQVVLRMKAASLNYRDLMIATGTYNPRQPLPLVLGSDGVGEVVSVGDGVRQVAVGDRVCPIFAQAWFGGQLTAAALKTTLGSPNDGVMAEHFACDAACVVKVPKHLSDEEAACLPCAAVTAWSALVTQGGIKAGDTVLTQGTGGVAIFALQFAKLLGARVIATSRSEAKLARAMDLGADEGILTEATPDWGKAARKLTDGIGVDHVIEVGGAGTLEQSIRAVRPGGTVSIIGVLSGGAGQIKLTPVLMQNIRLQGVFVGHRESFEAMNRAIAHHELRPVVDSTFGLAEARDAFVALQAAKHFGKITIRLTEAERTS